MISVEQRDNDIHTLAAINSEFSKLRSMSFLISGSYAIDALTHSPINHGDMDSNVFAPNLPEARSATLALLDDIQLSTGNLQLYKQTPDRLEYDIETPAQSANPRRLEIHLIEAVPEFTYQPNTYILADSKNRRVSRVSLVDINLKDSTGKDYLFKVKSLAYTIATWAIRISGVAQNQLRPVKESDLYFFSLLLAQRFTLTEVCSAIELHPQRSENKGPEEVFRIAQDILKGKG